MDSGQPEGNEVHVQGGSWIPATPMKPILPKPPLQQPLIYARTDRNQPRSCWLGSERLSSDSTKEAEASSGVACYGGANSMGADSSYNWDAASAGQFQVCNDNGTVAMHSIDGMGNIPFLQLLALADAATMVAADAALGGNASATFDSSSSLQIGLESSSMEGHLHGSCIPEAVAGYEISDQHAYDLNFPSGTELDAAALRITSQFAPPTPDPGKSKYTEMVAAVQQLPTENSRDEREQNHNYNTSIAIDGENMRENNELEPSTQSTITATCTPDGKEVEHALNPNKTPPPRQRRRKHRPKVIIEGKSKRTKPNSKAPSSDPIKRKRVRKNGLSKQSVTPSIEVTGETSDQELLKNRRKSCRRAINFDSQTQTTDDTSLCRPFNSGPLEQDSLAQNIQSTPGLVEVRLEEVGSSIDPNWSTNQNMKSNKSLPEKQAPSAEISAEHSSPKTSLPPNEQMENNTEQNGKVISSLEKGMLNDDTRSLPGSPSGLIFCPNPTLTEREQATCCQRKRSQVIKQTETSSINLTGVHYNALYAYQSMSWVHFPHIYKKKRTEKGQSAVSSSATAATHFMGPENACSFNNPQRNHTVPKSNRWIAGPQFNTCKSKTAAVHGGKDLQDKLQTYGSIVAVGQTERTKKRSRATKRICDLAPPARIADCEKQPIYPTDQPPVDSSKNIDTSQTHINALFEKMHATVAKKKRTKKNLPTNSALKNTNKDLRDCRFVFSNPYQFFPKTLGTTSEEHGNQMCFIDVIVEQLKHLDINKDSNNLAYTERALVPYNMQSQEHNAIVVYGRDGTIVPFNPIKKRRPRPKVELDEETGRVWKLLMGNINSEGIDGTDEEKIKWWEEERKVFRGRADSFIARMHLVQGDRRFSQWKGSVVDSVVGVFLTQNVSDHLSSSAFMSLAARFPPKPKCHQACYQEPIIELDEPEAFMLNLEDDMKLNKQIMHQQIIEEGSLMKHETEKSEGHKIVDSNESSGSNAEDGNSNKEPEKKTFSSSHDLLETCSNSVGEISLTGTSTMQEYCSGERVTYDLFSFQDCLDSSISQTSENTIEPSLEGNSEDLPSWSKEPHIDSSSEEFIQMAGLNTLNAHVTKDTSNDQSKNANNKIAGKNYDNGIEDIFQPDDNDIAAIKDSADHLNGYQMQLNPTSSSLDVDCCQKCNGAETSCVCQNKDEHFQNEQSTLTEESDNQATIEIEVVVDIHEAPLSSSELSINVKEQSLTLQSQGSVVEYPQNVESPAECTNIVHEVPLKYSQNASGIATQSIPKEYHSLSKEFKEMKAATSRSQRKPVGKEKEGNIKWDNLRKQTVSDGKTRQKTENTMDSLDWEAVRCADVKEIAHAIRERGMNNMLAERIKDFLNRLVKDHGSIDLEWLRDVAPDQAKEYLLSIRGLGLKSVECVRLLTLHHLAFPVDTNVGRIAVRLGWVPLQPLPESLQLHLLELYPVLESIQKYLWPRLCKLDQRTLYELHYQLITFGKVFCTKSKPNCNACPMRGECRHFASAFASARLGLPAPEDKRIVSTTQLREPDDNQAGIIGQPLLSLLPSTISSEEIKSSDLSHQSDEKIRIGTCVPIIEEPATPEQESIAQASISDIEDAFHEDPDEIPTIKLNIEEFSQNLQNYVQKNMELQEGDMSKALIALTPEAASIPMPKLKNVSRLRTEHQVYELPDSHPLLEKLKLDRREPDDPSSYLLAIWTPGETANSIQLPENRCSSQEFHQLCHEEECFSCNSVREAKSHMVRGTLLIPCRTAMRGSFPLNGTYFQVNEVFADHESSLDPIDVPREWLWNLPRRTVYFGTSIPTIFKGLSTQGIQHCFWRGLVCVRGFDQKSRAPRPLMARLHFPASKLNRGRGKTEDQ